MSKTKLDNTSEQNILNMLMESSSISNEQMTKINDTSAEMHDKSYHPKGLDP